MSVSTATVLEEGAPAIMSDEASKAGDGDFGMAPILGFVADEQPDETEWWRQDAAERAARGEESGARGRRSRT